MCRAVPAVGSYTFQRMRDLGLSDGHAKLAADFATISSFKPRDVILAKGAEATSWYFLFNGIVVASVAGSDGRTAPVSLYGQNTWFGEHSFINRSPNLADFIGLTSADVICLPATLVLDLIERDQGFSATVLKMMSWRAQKTSEMMVLMKLANPCLRVVMGICQIAETLAYRADRGPCGIPGEGVIIPIKHELISSLCGVSRTLFSEYAHVLERNGWLRVAYGKLEIISIETWYSFATLQRARGLRQLDLSMERVLDEFEKCSNSRACDAVSEAYAA